MANPYSADQSPDLSLASTPPSPNVASGQKVAIMPTSMPSIPREQPRIQPGTEDPGRMGIVDNVPYYHLNLAGEMPLPNPPFNAPSGSMINDPTFGTQDYSVPANRSYDLQAPGIDALPPMGVDPYLGDLLQFDRPHGIDITAASSNPLAIDPMNPDFSEYDRPADLAMPGLLQVDPLLPDLQYPSTTQEINSMVSDRPSELDPKALQIMHDDPTCAETPSYTYETLWMSQPGNNMRRERHLGMMYMGLERVEGKA